MSPSHGTFFRIVYKMAFLWLLSGRGIFMILSNQPGLSKATLMLSDLTLIDSLFSLWCNRINFVVEKSMVQPSFAAKTGVTEFVANILFTRPRSGESIWSIDNYQTHRVLHRCIWTQMSFRLLVVPRATHLGEYSLLALHGRLQKQFLQLLICVPQCRSYW